MNRKIMFILWLCSTAPVILLLTALEYYRICLFLSTMNLVGGIVYCVGMLGIFCYVVKPKEGKVKK